MNRIRKLGDILRYAGDGLELGAQLRCERRVPRRMQFNLIPASKSGLGSALVTQPENFLVALFVPIPNAVVAGVLGLLCGAESGLGIIVDTVKVLT